MSKVTETDLHRLSNRIFAGSLLFSGVLTMIIITWTWQAELPKIIEKPPAVVMLVENVPIIENRTVTPAPPVPFSAERPVERGEFIPDDVLVEESAAPAPVETAVPSGSIVGVPGVQPAIPGGPQIYESSAVEEPPRRQQNIIPEYPRLALRAGIEGTIVLKALVNTVGTVDSVVVMSGPEVFRESAVVAAEKTSFTPARMNRQPVFCWVVMQYRFNAP